jgi:hypothetical protein
MDETQPSWTAFAGHTRIATGTLRDVALAAKAVIDGGNSVDAVMVLDDRDSQRVEIDFRGDEAYILAQLPDPPEAIDPDAPRGRGRPKLGVIPREVTLLPRHWDWLNRQPGGASVALRKLVEEARHTHQARDRIRWSQEAAYRFMSIMAGDSPGFEEAARALFASNHVRFDAMTGGWPVDVRDHVQRLAAGAFTAEADNPVADERKTA